MITQILFSCLALHNPAVVPEYWLGQLKIGKPTTHLKSFFDARSAGAGSPIFLLFEPHAPKVATAPKHHFVAARKFDPVSPRKAATRVLSANVSRAKKVVAIAARTSHIPAATMAVVPAKAQPKTVAPEEVPIKVNVAGARVDQLLAWVAKEAGTGIIMIAKTDLKVTYSATNRKFIDVLRDICGLAGVSYLKVGDDYVINTDDELKKYYPDDYARAHPEKPGDVKLQPEIISDIYKTNYCDANKLLTTLQTIPEFKTEDLVCIAAPSSVSPSLDTTDESQKSGQASSVLNKDQNIVGKVSRALFLRGPKQLVRDAMETLNALDVAPAQVNISVQIHDISLDAEKNLGINWTFGQVSLVEQAHAGIGFGSVDRTPFNFQATLNALMSKNEEKLLASPNITVQDGERAYVLVGQRLDFPIIVSYTQSGQPVFNTDQERVGIYLQVSVWVTNDGKVKLNLYPQVSTVTGFINVNGGNYPQIATREAQTTLTVESGKMIAIGGLIHEEDIKNVQDVPIISKIPIIGEFFRNHQLTHTKDEVLITITPTILPSK